MCSSPQKTSKRNHSNSFKKIWSHCAAPLWAGHKMCICRLVLPWLLLSGDWSLTFIPVINFWRHLHHRAAHFFLHKYFHKLCLYNEDFKGKALSLHPEGWGSRCGGSSRWQTSVGPSLLYALTPSAVEQAEPSRSVELGLTSPRCCFKLIEYEPDATKADPIEEMDPFVLSFLIFKPSRFHLFTKAGLR